MFSSLKLFAHLGELLEVELGGVLTPPTCVYVAEDGTTFYVAEDGSTFYIPESCPAFLLSLNFNMIGGPAANFIGNSWRVI